MYKRQETKNARDFAKKLASFADLYVNDAFGTAHRAHASTAGLANFLPAVSGYLIEKELQVMGGALADPESPFVAILGGAKVSDKIGVIENLLNKVDTQMCIRDRISGVTWNKKAKIKGADTARI